MRLLCLGGGTVQMRHLIRKPPCVKRSSRATNNQRTELLQAVIILTKPALDEADQPSSATRARHPRRDRLGRATEFGFFVCSCRPSKTRFFLQADAANSGHLDWGSGHPNGRVQLCSFSFRSRSRKLAMVQGPKLRPIRRVRDHLLAVSRASASIASLGPRV
jgi:hypothetical protein